MVEPGSFEPCEVNEGENLDSQVLTESMVSERGAHHGNGDIESKLRSKTTLTGDQLTKGKSFAKGVTMPAVEVTAIEEDNQMMVTVENKGGDMRIKKH